MVWFLLASLAAMLEATTDVLKKYLRPQPMATVAVPLAITSVLGFALILVGREFSQSDFFPRAWPTVNFYPAVAAAGLLNCLALPLYIKAVRMSDLSIVVPYVSLTTVFLLVSGWLIAGDRISLAGGAGVLLVAFGIFVIHAKGKSGLVRAVKAASHDPGVRRMIAVAAIFSFTASLEKVGVQQGGALSTIAVETLLIALVLGLVLFFRGVRPTVKKVLSLVPLSLVQFGVLMAHFSALLLVPVVYVISIKRFSILLSVLAGIVFFRERQAIAARIFGAALMTAGAVLILLLGRA